MQTYWSKHKSGSFSFSKCKTSQLQCSSILLTELSKGIYGFKATLWNAFFFFFPNLMSKVDQLTVEQVMSQCTKPIQVGVVLAVFETSKLQL